jgi:2-dehydro-3-deoxyglucarate aldolase/4-hydroxy-2-oxoheptanedioate aldolase
MTTERGPLEEVIEKGGFDFVSVDSQHAAFNEERLWGFCQMAAEIGIHVQFRIKHTRHTYLVGNYLDLGPSGVEVPQVELEETVEDAVANFYYPQRGVRSWGGRARLGSGSRPDHVEYRKWWNETGVLWIQIESVDAVSNARQLSKAGVDCLSFGPMDLTLSLEAHPLHPFKTVDDCVQHVVDLLDGSDTKVCYRNNTPDARQKYLDMGVTVMLELGAHYGL